MKSIGIILNFVLALVLGVFGLIFFFGDNENIIKLILSKPLGIMLLSASFVLFRSLKTKFNTI